MSSRQLRAGFKMLTPRTQRLGRLPSHRALHNYATSAEKTNILLKRAIYKVEEDPAIKIVQFTEAGDDGELFYTM
jgi:hypothetical protein